MTKFDGWKKAYAVLLLCAATAIASPAKITFTTLLSFAGSNGANPEFMSLVQGTDGNFYGTTRSGGANGLGTVFKITRGGTLTVLHSFAGADGEEPYGGLVQATDGNFYGTTFYGGTGANGLGTVFKITAGGTLTTLYNFCFQTSCADGDNPNAGLVQGSDGNLYGTTQAGGGVNDSGTVFKITPSGTLTTLYSFCSQGGVCIDGAYPSAVLLQATDGRFYGTTAQGGSNGLGTVFKISAGGTLTTLHSFNGTDGDFPATALVQATNGKFYGTTGGGGAATYGTVFKMTPGGALTTLYSFCSNTNCTDGANPQAGLIQATDGNIYGTTYDGGANNDGTVFKITAGGTLTTLHSFAGTDGSNPDGGLLQATNGTFYGTANLAGANSDGTVFSLAAGLGPFVETRPTSGKVGAKVIILGTNLTGATNVTFNGTAATFKVVSKSEIKTTVPTGATTGTVEVKTPKKTLKSSVAFRVTK
jgi:uncharacterized repeat protein (TIGR03803 family)